MYSLTIMTHVLPNNHDKNGKLCYCSYSRCQIHRLMQNLDFCITCLCFTYFCITYFCITYFCITYFCITCLCFTYFFITYLCFTYFCITYFCITYCALLIFVLLIVLYSFGTECALKKHKFCPMTINWQA